jgi:hypothetical protein
MNFVVSAGHLILLELLSLLVCDETGHTAGIALNCSRVTPSERPLRERKRYRDIAV